MPLGGLWSGEPVLARHGDGRLELFAVGLNGHLFRKPQSGPSQAFVPDWTPLPPDYRDFAYHEEIYFDPLTTRIGHALGNDGRLCIFLRTARGRIVFSRADASGLGWSNWASIAAVQDRHLPLGNPVACALPVSGGFNTILVIRSRLSEILLQSHIPRHGEESWSIVGSHISADPAVACRLDGSTLTTSIFARGIDGNLWWNGERVRRGSVTAYAGLRRTRSGSAGSALAGRPIATSPESAIWRGIDGQIWQSSMSPSTFGTFGLPSPIGVTTPFDPASVDHGGNHWLFFVSAGGELMMRRRPRGRGIAGSVSLSAGLGVRMVGPPFAAPSADGRIQVGCVGADGAMFHFFETAVGSGTFGEGH